MQHSDKQFLKNENVVMIPIYSDNYVFIYKCPKTQKCAIIDPGLAKPVLEYIDEHKLQVEKILLTHHHWDHITGVDEIREKTGADVVGNVKDQARLPKLDLAISPGDKVRVGETVFQTIELNGHTIGHIAYHAANPNGALFSGDTLFAMGCGRRYEGSPEQMWDSLLRIRNLPKETLVFCTHEYTLANSKFCSLTFPDISSYAEQTPNIEERIRQEGKSIPFTLAEEIRRNPFLNCDSPKIAEALNLNSKPAHEVFAHLRRLKDEF